MLNSDYDLNSSHDEIEEATEEESEEDFTLVNLELENIANNRSLVPRPAARNLISKTRRHFAMTPYAKNLCRRLKLVLT